MGTSGAKEDASRRVDQCRQMFATTASLLSRGTLGGAPGERLSGRGAEDDPWVPLLEGAGFCLAIAGDKLARARDGGQRRRRHMSPRGSRRRTSRGRSRCRPSTLEKESTAERDLKAPSPPSAA
ncbi:hypothetical protein MRX96_047434 [Rhipicephalus microplus]